MSNLNNLSNFEVSDEIKEITDASNSDTEVELEESEQLENEELDSDEDIEGEGEEVDTDEAEEGEDVDVEEEQEAELVAVELDGTNYEVPPELAPAIMRNKDYTLKTQKHAESVRSFEAEKEQFAAEKVRTEEDLKLDVQSYQLADALKKYEGVDWDAEEAADQELASREFNRMQRLLNQQSAVNDQRKESSDKRSQAATVATAKRTEEAEAWATKNLPGWSPKMAEDLFNFATQDMGYGQDEFKNNLSPKFLDLLSKAHVGHIATKKSKTAKTVKKTFKPTKTVSAKSPGTTRKDPAEMSMNDFAKYRKSKLKE